MVPTQKPPTERDKSRRIPEEMEPRSRMQKPESRCQPHALVHEGTFLTHVRTYWSCGSVSTLLQKAGI